MQCGVLARLPTTGGRQNLPHRASAFPVFLSLLCSSHFVVILEIFILNIIGGCSLLWDKGGWWRM